MRYAGSIPALCGIFEQHLYVSAMFLIVATVQHNTCWVNKNDGGNQYIMQTMYKIPHDAGVSHSHRIVLNISQNICIFYKKMKYF